MENMMRFFRFQYLAILIASMLLPTFASAQATKVVPAEFECRPKQTARPVTVRSIEFSANELSPLYVGDTLVRHPKVRMSNGARTIELTAMSGDTSIVTADIGPTGELEVTGLKPGKTTIKLTPTKDPMKAETYPVEVRAPKVPAGYISATDKDAVRKAAMALGVCPSTDGLIPWWWLLVAFMAGALLVWLMRRNHRFTQADLDRAAADARRENQEAVNEANRQRDNALAALNRSEQDLVRLRARRQAEIAEAIAAAHNTRIEELEAEVARLTALLNRLREIRRQREALDAEEEAILNPPPARPQGQ